MGEESETETGNDIIEMRWLHLSSAALICFCSVATFRPQRSLSQESPLYLSY